MLKLHAFQCHTELDKTLANTKDPTTFDKFLQMKKLSVIKIKAISLPSLKYYTKTNSIPFFVSKVTQIFLIDASLFLNLTFALTAVNFKTRPKRNNCERMLFIYL